MNVFTNLIVNSTLLFNRVALEDILNISILCVHGKIIRQSQCEHFRIVVLDQNFFSFRNN